MPRFDLVIYHANCADGFTAAWVAWNVLGDKDVTYVSAAYGQQPPDVAGKHVLILDFSYSRELLWKMADPGEGRGAASITILDHHKSAAKELDEFLGEDGHPDVTAYFDMGRSGAMMTWDFFHPESEAPLLVKYVQDRDLWKFELQHSRDVAAWLFSFDYTWENWSDCAAQLRHINGIRGAVAQGEAINRKHDKDIRELLAVNTFEAMIGGHLVLVANMPYTMASDAAHILAEGRAFGGTFYIEADGRYKWSLRSRPDGADVSQTARSLDDDGGGHRH